MSEERMNQLAVLIKPALDKYRDGVIAYDRHARFALDEIVAILYNIGHVIVPEDPSNKMLAKAEREYSNPHSTLASIIRAANGRDNVTEKDK